jgi:hypothetical protein
MRPEHLNELRDKNFLTEDQHGQLDSILSKRVFSVYYELRIVLYLGVLLFTTGIGILIYKNIGDLGHLASIALLFILTAICFWYTFRNAMDYSNGKTTPQTPYYDYVVLLGCLLFISVLGYLQFQYSLFDEGMGATTLVTAALFFYVAYRFDHLGVLSLAITALASFWSISVSPQKWYSGDFFEKADLHITAIAFGAALSAIALTLDRKVIKAHFTFTYINFCSLIFLTGALAGMFINNDAYAVYLFTLYAGCALLVYYAHQKKSFLFLLYAFVSGYIGTTFFLTDTVLRDPFVWFFYLIASCGGFIFFIVRYKSYFKRAE